MKSPPCRNLRVLLAGLALMLSLLPAGARANLVTNGGFTNGLTAWSTAGNVTNAPGFSLTLDGTNRSTLFQTVQQEGLPLNLSLDFVFGVMSGSVPSGFFADTAYFSIYESTNAATLRPDLDQFDAVTPLFDATAAGFTNLAPGVTIQPSPRGAAWWTVLLTNYVASHDFVAPTLEVYNFNGTPDDSTAPMTAVVMSSVPEPGVLSLLLGALIFVAVSRIRGWQAFAFGFLLFPIGAAMPLRAQMPASLGARVRVTTANETTTFDRATRLVTQNADVTLTNIGDRPLKGPLRVRITLVGEGDLSLVNVAGVQAGGDGDERPYYDLSALVPAGGLAPKASASFSLRLVRPYDLKVSYQLEAQGVFNRDPTAAFEAPLASVAGEEVSFDAAASDDGDGGKQISYAWNFGDGGTSDSVAPRRVFARPGRYDVALTLTDGEGAKAVLRKTISVLPSANFAVARTRTLDASGQPLGAVTVHQRVGTEVTESTSDAATGFSALGGEPADYVWRFSREGYLPVWRKASLGARQILFVPSPWLVRESAEDKLVSPLRELVLGGANEPATIAFAAGAFAAEGAAGFTPIGPQALPLPLPAGWSPLGAFHIALPSTPSQGGVVAWVPSDELGSDDALAMLKYDADLLQWTVVSLPSPGASPTGEVDEGSTYALVVADKGSRAPPAPQPGAALPAAADVSFDSSAVSAAGSVDPAALTAQRDAKSMTSTGRVIFTGGLDLPSGTFFRTEIEEVYNLANGRTQRTPVYDTSFFAYQRPGDSESKTLHAAFPLRPTRLIAPEQIDTAKIEAIVLAGDSYAASLFDQTGGRIAAENLAVSAEAGDLSGRSLAELRFLDVEGFEVPLAGRTGVAAFQLSVGNLAPGRGLEVELSGLAPNSNFVVARHVAKDDEEGFEPLERLSTDAEGNARSVEPTEGVRLPGVTGPGQFVVIAVDGPQAVISGVARNLAGEAIAGLAVRIGGLPWLTFSALDGGYKLVASQGATSTVAVTDLSDGNSGNSEVVVEGGANNAQADVRAVTTAPRVASVSPADGAEKVRAATPVKIRFSEPLDRATFGPDAMTLTDPMGVLIQGSLSLDQAGTEATFLPTNPLEHAAAYTIELSAGIKDRQGLPLDGARLFSFSVVPFFERAQGAQLVIYEPGADKIPTSVTSMLVGYNSGEGSSHVVAHGSAGAADAEVPVILVNQNTGETATVLSKPDGSFASFINAAQEDFIEAVFVNANGTRVTVPATRQIYDNGRVGLYRYGGILEASNEEAGKVEVLIEPGAIADRTVFSLQRQSIAEAAALLNGLLPRDGATIAGGFSFESEGSELSSQPTVKLTVRPGELGLPEGEVARAGDFVLTNTREVNGLRVFAINAVPEEQVRSQRSFGLLLVMTVGEPLSRNNILLHLRGTKLAVTGSVSAAGGRGLVDAADEKRVPGAFVFAGDVDSEGMPVRDANGILLTPELREGVVGTTTSPQNGGFRFSVPLDRADAMPAIFAVSPLFPVQVAAATSRVVGDGSLSGFARVAFPHFRAPDLSIEADRVPPRISFSFNPPKPGALGNLSPFALNISCSDRESVVPPDVQLSLVSFKPIAAEDEGKKAEENLTFSLVEDLQIGATRRQKWQMNAFIPAEVEFEISARDSSGNPQLSRAFVTIEPSVLLYAAGKGPMVIGTSPQPGSAGVDRSEPVIIRFSEPIDPASLIFVDTMFSVPVVDARLADQNRELIVRLAPSDGNLEVSATISPLLQNVAGGFFDQDPTTDDHDSYSFSFDYASDRLRNKLPLTDAAGIAAGKSVPGLISYYFAIDRTKADSGELLSFEAKASEPLNILARVPLPPFPRDVLYLGSYNFLHPIVGKTKADLLVVIGGLAGVGQDSWICVFDVSNPTAPRKIASSSLGLGGATLGVKLAWSAPRLGILLLGPEQTSVMELDMQLLLHAQNLADYSKEPAGGALGIDLNGDGDYVDAGETIPRPQGAAPPVGLVNGGAVENTSLTAASAATWRFTDFDLGGAATESHLSGWTDRPFGGRWLVACSRSLDPGVRHRFWVLKAPGEIVNDQDDGVGFIDLDAEPVRVKLLPSRELIFPGPDGTQTTEFRDLALVSLNDGHLLVLDVTDPRAPSILNKLQFNPSDGKPRSIVVGRDGLLYLACTENMLVLDPRYLAFGQSLANPYASFQRAYVHRMHGLGTGNRAFVANSMDEVGVAFGGKSLLASLALPAEPPKITGLRLIHFVEKPKSLAEKASGDPAKVIKRISQNGKLELVDPFSVTGRLRFSPRVNGEASYAPANQVLPRRYPVWKFQEAPPLGPQAPFLPAPVTIQSGFANADLKPHIPAFSRSYAGILANALPLVDFGMLAAASPDIHEVYCENQKVDLAVYTGFLLDRKIELNTKQGTLTPFAWITTKAAVLVSRLTGGAATLMVESKGILGYKAQWAEKESSHEAIYTLSVNAGCDPLVGLKGEISIPPPGPPPVVLLAKAVGAKFFVELGGSVTFIGSLGRDAKDQIIEALELGGKMTLGLGAKLTNTLIEAKVSGDTGISVKAKCEVSLSQKVEVKLKGPTMSFEGLAVKIGFKSLTGSFRPTQQKFTLIEPEVLFKASDLPLL